MVPEANQPVSLVHLSPPPYTSPSIICNVPPPNPIDKGGGGGYKERGLLYGEGGVLGAVVGL